MTAVTTNRSLTIQPRIFLFGPQRGLPHVEWAAAIRGIAALPSHAGCNVNHCGNTYVL